MHEQLTIWAVNTVEGPKTWLSKWNHSPIFHINCETPEAALSAAMQEREADIRDDFVDGSPDWDHEEWLDTWYDTDTGAR
jgi:predicted kinase